MTPIRARGAGQRFPLRGTGVITLGAAMFAAAVLSCSGDALDPDRSPVAAVVVTPPQLSVGVGASAPLTAEARDAAGGPLRGRKIAWASQDPSVATVSNTGVVTGVTVGTVQVAATSEGKSAVVNVTVTPKAVASIRLTPSGDLNLLVSESKQMTAEPLDADGAALTDRALTWSSNSPAIASVSPTGLITAVAPGGAVITVASEGKTAVVAVTVTAVPVASVAVTPAIGTVVVSQSLQLAATAKDAQGGTLAGRVVAWSSSDAAIATVSSTGLVVGVAPGTITITATSEGKSGSASITVAPKPVAAVIVSPAQLTLETGKSQTLTVQVTDGQGNVLTGRAITFRSSNAAVATVSSSGVVSAVSLGQATITATSEGTSGTADVTVVAVPVASVEVSPATADLIVGGTTTLTATAKDAAGNTLTGRTATWSSGSTSIATVSPDGVVTAAAPGEVVIFASIEGKIGSATVTVRSAPAPVATVTVTPNPATVKVGQTVQLTATLRDASGIELTGRDVTWSSSNILRATVSETGLVRGVSKGTVTIKATSEGKFGTSSVSVQ